MCWEGLTYLMYAFLFHLPIIRTWVSDAPLHAASETAPILKLNHVATRLQRCPLHMLGSLVVSA